MKLYNVKPVEKEFSFGRMQVVILGEEGRGRKMVYVPFHAEYDPESDHYELSATKSGRKKIVLGDKPSPGWIARIKTEGTYTRGTVGSAVIPKDQQHNITLVAHGWGAYGDAGRIGTWSDYLITVHVFPTIIRVRPSGGKYKIPRYWLVFLEDRVVRVNDTEAEIFEDQAGIDLSRNFENYVLLENIQK